MQNTTAIAMFSVDASDVASAASEVGDGLILQNARFSHRYDPLRHRRNPRTESILILTGRCLSAVAVALSVICATRFGPSSYPVVAIAITLLTGFFVLPWLRPAWIQRLDRKLRANATGAAQVWRSRVPASIELRHTSSDRLVVKWFKTSDDATPFHVSEIDLDRIGYALVGRAAVLFFGKQTDIRVYKVLIVPGALMTPALVTFLEDAGVRWEALTPALLPPSPITRDFRSASFVELDGSP